MQALSHSPFLQALGYAIANSLWQVALLWLVVVLLNSIVNFAAATRYRIALTAQFGAFAWFLVTFKVYFQQCTAAVLALDSLNITNENAWIVTPQGTSFRSSVLAWTIKIEQLLPFLSIAYLFLLVFLCVKWIRSYRKAQYIRSSGLQKIDVEWRLFVQKVATQLNIKPKVQIFLSAVVNSPLTIGYLKPVILIPIASITHLTPQQLEALILHELAHIKRADYFINLLQSVIEITLFFNPFTQLLSRHIRNERENSCDDWVLQFQYNPSMYAEALLRMAHLQGAPAFAMQARGNKGELLPRVKRMLNQQEKNFNYKQHLVALLVMTGVLSTTAWLQPGKHNTLAASQQNSAQRSVVIEPITARVDNPLFNPVFFLAKPLQEEVRTAKTKAKEAEKIRAVAAARYQEAKEEHTITIEANEKDTVVVAEAPLQPVPDVVVVNAAMPAMPAPQPVFQIQTLPDMQSAGATAVTVASNYQFRFFNRRQQENASRYKLKLTPPPPPRKGPQRAQGREFGPPPPVAMMMRQMMDSSRRNNEYHRNMNRMIASIIKEVTDSGRLRKSKQFHLQQMPPKDMLDPQTIEEAFKIFDKKDTWAYFRPVMKDREHTRTDATISISSRSTGDAVVAVATNGNEDYHYQATSAPAATAQSATGCGCPPAVQQQVVTYQYKDVMITISSNTINGNVTPGSQSITIRKLVKGPKNENEVNNGQFFSEEPLNTNDLQHD
jgi:beta-lactamase regulating signal transducer with metallopeptidase domain